MKIRVNMSERDPTGTALETTRYLAQMRKRFAELAALIRSMIVDQDVFGIAELSTNSELSFRVHRDSAADRARKGRYRLRNRRAWALDRNPEKVRLFMAWLAEMEALGILEIIDNGGEAVAGSSLWSSIFVDTAYRKALREGARDALSSLPADKAARLRAAGWSGSADWAREALLGPVHADRLGLLYTRSFEDLEGITRDMDEKISRTLTIGLANGQNPLDLADDLVDAVTGRGPAQGIAREGMSAIARAELLARTEMIFANQSGSVNLTLEAGRLLGEEVFVEWVTALDTRVRDTHRDRHGQVFTASGVQALLGEPNCRCAVVSKFQSARGFSPDRDVADADDFLPV